MAETKYCKDCRFGDQRVLGGLTEDTLCEHPSGTDERVSMVTGIVVERRRLTCEENRLGDYDPNKFSWGQRPRLDGKVCCGADGQFFAPLP